jgi:hypothetical protein
MNGDGRPLCAETSSERGEPLAATASRVEHWLLVEHTGMWPHDPLAAGVFVGAVREHLARQLRELPRARVLLVKRPRARRTDRVQVAYGWTRERGSRFFTFELGDHRELLDLDLGAALRDGSAPLGEQLEHPLLLVCTHGKRDRCCARYGQPLCAALSRSRSADWMWQSTHVGGDRFAGNIVCLPEGLYFGRVEPHDVEALLARYRDGRIDVDRYRGRCCYGFPAQAAERAVRQESGLDGFYDLRVTAERKEEGDRWTFELVAEVSGTVYRVEVERRPAEPAYLTCHAREPRRAPLFVATSVDVT